MARERAFTDEQIAAAAAELQKDGKAVNGTSLRNKIGVGRPSLLLSVYEELCKKGTVIVPKQVEKQAETERHYDLDPAVAEMRDVLLGDLDVMIQNINNAANACAENKLRAAVVEATELKVFAEQQVADATERETAAYNESEDLRDLIDERDETIKEKLTLITTLRDQLSDMHRALEVSKAQTKAQEEVVVERNTRIKELNDKFDRAVSAKDAALSEKSEAIGEVRALTKQSNQLALDLEAEKTKNERLTAECASMTTKVEMQAESLSSTNATVKELTSKLSTANATVKELKDQIAAAKKAEKTTTSTKKQVK